MKYPLTSIKSGDDAKFGIWVSLGFTSNDGESHGLHIVGGEETDPQRIAMGLLPIYLEKDDQSLSCYQGAEKILVEDSLLTITLNKNAQDSLELPKNIQFVTTKAGSEFEKAKTIFTKMQTFKSGEIIHVA